MLQLRENKVLYEIRTKDWKKLEPFWPKIQHGISDVEEKFAGGFEILDKTLAGDSIYLFVSEIDKSAHKWVGSICKNTYDLGHLCDFKDKTRLFFWKEIRITKKILKHLAHIDAKFHKHVSINIIKI